MVVELPTDLTPVKPPETPCEIVKQEIAKYSGWDASTIFAIAQAENDTCDPLRHNLKSEENHGVCVGSYGVLQVGCVHYNGEDVDSLETNVAIAYEVWQKQGYTAWTMYNNGTYLEFL